MNYYAKVINGRVTKVMKCDEDFFNSFEDNNPGDWIQTFKPCDGSAEQRYNYAGVDYHYDADGDAFYEPSPFASWTLDENFKWQAPTPYPTDIPQVEGVDGEMVDSVCYVWDEDTLAWIEKE